MCVWLCKFIVGGHSLWGTGGHSRCWDWRQHVGAICVGVSEYESMGGRTASGGIWKISHENSCCALRTRTLQRETYSCWRTARCSSACMRQQTWFNMMWYFQLLGASEGNIVAITCPPTVPVKINNAVFAHNNHILSCVSLFRFSYKHRHWWVWTRRTRLSAQPAVYQLTGCLHLSVSGWLPQGRHGVHWWDNLNLSFK